MRFIKGLERLARLGRVSAQTGRQLRNGLGLFTATVNIPAVTSGQQSLVDVTVNGIRTTDLLLGFDFRPTTSTDIGYDANITADNTVRLICHHDAATTTNPDSATLTVLVIRPQLEAGLKRLAKEVDLQRRTANDVVNAIQVWTATVNVGAMTSGKQTIQNVTFTGITTDMILIAQDFRPGTSTDVAYTTAIVAADTVQLTSHHSAATTTNPDSATLTIWTLKP
jgi:hypothetical protein